MDTLSFINECFEEIGVAPATATSCEIPEGHAPAEYGNLIVTLYRYGVAYDIDLQRDRITLYAVDPDGRLPDTPRTFYLTSLDWWADFREWLAAEIEQIIEAGTA